MLAFAHIGQLCVHTDISCLHSHLEQRKASSVLSLAYIQKAFLTSHRSKTLVIDMAGLMPTIHIYSALHLLYTLTSLQLPIGIFDFLA